MTADIKTERRLTPAELSDRYTPDDRLAAAAAFLQGAGQTTLAAEVRIARQLLRNIGTGSGRAFLDEDSKPVLVGLEKVKAEMLRQGWNAWEMCIKNAIDLIERNQAACDRHDANDELATARAEIARLNEQLKSNASPPDLSESALFGLYEKQNEQIAELQQQLGNQRQQLHSVAQLSRSFLFDFVPDEPDDNAQDHRAFVVLLDWVVENTKETE